ncbi:MAG: UDP-N-acetylmuramoyl-L-alanine--D-glutamate ligase [Pseudomonadota bacterium]
MKIDIVKTRFRHALVWGYGLEGRAVRQFLAARCPDLAISVADQSEAFAAELGNGFVRQEDMGAFIAAHAPVLLIKSPGISPYGEDFTRLISAGAVSTSQTNLWLANRPAHQTAIAITGTKGKSTTSTMVHHILARCGKRAELGGNVGRPVCEIGSDAEIVVVEMSSYQGADLVHGFDYAMLLNLDADHIPWHRSLEAYHRDKLNILVQSAAGQLIVPARERQRFAALETAKPMQLHGAAPGIWVDDRGILRASDRALEVPAHILGVHNRRNLAAALTLVENFGIAADAALAALSDFKPLAHRLETVATIAGTRFISDAIATTPAACWSAVEAFQDEDLVLVLGGTERGQDYDWLAKRLKTRQTLKRLILIPDNADRIASVLAAHGLADITTAYDDFDTAIRAAPAFLPSGGVVLLSPAAPRGSAFGHINARGERFREIAQSLSE